MVSGVLPDVDAIAAGGFTGRYDLERARKDLDNLATNVDFFNNQKLPDVRLETSFRSNGLGGTRFLRSGGFPGTITGSVDRGYGSVLGDMFGSTYPSWSVGLTVNYSLGKSYEEAGLARAQVERRQAAQRIASLQLRIGETLRQAVRQVHSTSERIEAARAGQTVARQRLDVEQRRFEVGLSTSFLVTQAQRDLLQTEVNLLQAMLDHQSALVSFEALQDAPRWARPRATRRTRLSFRCPRLHRRGCSGPARRGFDKLREASVFASRWKRARRSRSCALASGDYLAAGRSIPSLAIFDCSVVRFMPSFAAAPEGPPTSQLACCSA